MKEMTIEKVGFVSTLPDGRIFRHDWGYSYTPSRDGYTAENLKKISEAFYGDSLEYYRRRSSYGSLAIHKQR